MLDFVFIAENCSGYCTCAHCLEQPGCGWCTDPSNTGKGKCIEGSYRGPVKMPTPSSTGKHSLEPVLNVSMCPVENNYNWSFIQCPGKWAVFNCSGNSAMATIKCEGRDCFRLLCCLCFLLFMERGKEGRQRREEKLGRQRRNNTFWGGRSYASVCRGAEWRLAMHYCSEMFPFPTNLYWV